MGKFQDKTKILKPHNVSERMSRMLADESIDVILFDELTYMVSYGYIELDEVVEALNNRPKMQSVIITGRGARIELWTEMADTVSEVRNVKHAFESGVKALCCGRLVISFN